MSEPLISLEPAIADVIHAAKELGFEITPERADVYRRHLAKRLEATAAFLQSDLGPAGPPLRFGAREPGHAPSEQEDPLGAWLWKCEIKGADTGLLAGKTVSFKDHIAVAGVPLTFGSPILGDYVPEFDATVVTRVLSAGGTVVGKNNLDGLEGGAGVAGPAVARRARNPHRPSHVPGGSSSGSAVAVAAGEVDISFGGCQGGSLRIPAAWCGCVGLKATFGLISHFGAAFGLDWIIDYVGPLARTHEDVAAAFDAVAGYDELDQRAGRAIPDRMDALSTLADGVCGLRIGLLDEGFAGADAEVADAVLAAADVLVAAGARVTRVSLPEHLQIGDTLDALYCEGARALRATGFLGAFAPTYYPESLVAAVNRYWRDHSERLKDSLKFRYLVGEFTKRAFDGRSYAKAHNARPYFIRAYDRALTDLDVLLMPTVIRTAPEYSEPGEHSLDATLSGEGPREYWFNRNTKPLNYTGHPALAVPCGMSSAGLPISMQLVGRWLADPLLLRVGYAYQHSVDWSRFRPAPA